MKALSMWQPWASLVAIGAKRVETRCWSTKHRGPLAIHATKNEATVYSDWRTRRQFVEAICRITKENGWGSFWWKDGERGLGVVLCTVNLVACCPVEDVRDDLSDDERFFGNFDDGRFAWFFDDLRVFDKPIPAKGNRLLWEWTIPNSVCPNLGSVLKPATP